MKKERYDAQRKFSHDQKVQMGERQEFLCGGGCGRSFWRQPLSSAQAHHIIPFSLNGLTELPNGILLCSECHKKYDQMAIQEGRIMVETTHSPMQSQNSLERNNHV